MVETEFIDRVSPLVTIEAIHAVLRCPCCGPAKVVHNGVCRRLIREVPSGSQDVWFDGRVPGVHCRSCQITRQVELASDPSSSSHTSIFERLNGMMKWFLRTLPPDQRRNNGLNVNEDPAPPFVTGEPVSAQPVATDPVETAQFTPVLADTSEPGRRSVPMCAVGDCTSLSSTSASPESPTSLALLGCDE